MAHSWVTCLIHECYIIHSCPHSFICVTRRRNVLVRDLWVRIIHVCDMRVTHSCTIRLIYGLHNSSIRLIRMSYMTPLCAWHDAFLSGTRLIHLCDMAHSYMWQVSRCPSSDMTNSSMWHNSFIRVTCLIELWYATHPYLSHDVFTCVTHQHECLRFVQLGEKCVTWRHHTFICCIHMC